MVTAWKKKRKYRGQNSRRDARKCPELAREEMRIRGVSMILQFKVKPSEVARAFGVCESCVNRWLDKYEISGLAGLKKKAASEKKTGKRILTDEEEAQICCLVRTSTPLQHGFPVVLWTRKIVAILIENLYGKKISESSTGRLMRRHKLSPQKPIRRAYQRDQKEVDTWCTDIFPALKERAENEKAEILWLDEATFRSDHAFGTTWAPKGETPVVPAEGSPQKCNAIGTISEDGFLDIMTFDGTANSEVFCAYVEHLHKVRPRKIIIILDNARFHCSERVENMLKKYAGWIELHFLPKYSPDLNPMELVWSLLKSRELNKKIVKGKEEFVSLAHQEIEKLANDKQKCKALFGKKDVHYISSRKLSEAA